MWLKCEYSLYALLYIYEATLKKWKISGVDRMLNLNGKSLLLTSLIVVSGVACAQSNEYLVVNQCLSEKIVNNIQVVAEQGNYRLVELSSNDVDDVANIAHKNKACGGFFNVSHKMSKRRAMTAQDEAKSILRDYVPKQVKSIKSLQSDAYKISHQQTVDQLIESIDLDAIWNTLTQLTNFNNRSGRTDEGVEAANWVKSQFDKMAAEYGRDDVKSYLVDTIYRQYQQPSVVTVIGKDIKADAVVIGAHMDTLSTDYFNPVMPGADDNGSGTSSLMEAARVLLSSKTTLKHPVYIVWYAAEEYGLYGSQSVVEDFIVKNIPVKAVLQLDMTGFRRNGNSKVWMITDYVNQQLTNFVADLAKTYANVKVGTTRCGYACSDHASWSREGFTVAFPVESKFGKEDPYIHTEDDIMDHVSVDHMASFSKIGIGFAIELAS